MNKMNGGFMMLFLAFIGCLFVVSWALCAVVTVWRNRDKADSELKRQNMIMASLFSLLTTAIIGLVVSYLLEYQSQLSTEPPTCKLIASYPIVDNTKENEEQFWFRIPTPDSSTEVAIIFVDEDYRIEEWEVATTVRRRWLFIYEAKTTTKRIIKVYFPKGEYFDQFDFAAPYGAFFMRANYIWKIFSQF